MNKAAAAAAGVIARQGAGGVGGGPCPAIWTGTEGAPRGQKPPVLRPGWPPPAACRWCWWDERRTTVTAAAILADNDTFGAKRKQKLDAVSAAVILESFLSWRRQHPGDNPA